MRDADDIKPAIHFIRFKNDWDEHYNRAVRFFGEPDFLHRLYDHHALSDIAPCDTLVFGKGDFTQEVSPFNGAGWFEEF